MWRRCQKPSQQWASHSTICSFGPPMDVPKLYVAGYRSRQGCGASKEDAMSSTGQIVVGVDIGKTNSINYGRDVKAIVLRQTSSRGRAHPRAMM